MFSDSLRHFYINRYILVWLGKGVVYFIASFIDFKAWNHNYCELIHVCLPNINHVDDQGNHGDEGMC